jgi:hydroxymethylglutaryl-CoA reductase
MNLAEKFVENVIGYFQLPLGVATNFKIDGREYLIPMAVEETSIIAAASKTAKWVRECGSISTSSLGDDIIGQIQISKVKNREKLQLVIDENKADLMAQANSLVAHGLVARGGGVVDMQVRFISRNELAQDSYGLRGLDSASGEMAVIHVMMNPCDAMGANIMNQVCEFLKSPIETLSGESVKMCILSNLVDTKLTRAEVTIRNIDRKMGEAIEEASLFSQLDPYRAATNNKGVLNGIDPILIATGNDWRAVDAGVHSFAASTGRYKSITRWKMSGNDLVGELVAPIVVGTVGGVTKLHPTAMLCLKMLKVESASELSRVMAAVGLVQNLGALKALTTVGIIEGHMKLHIKNLALGAGALEIEVPFVQKRLEQILSLTKRVSLNHAVEALLEFRKNSSSGFDDAVSGAAPGSFAGSPSGSPKDSSVGVAAGSTASSGARRSVDLLASQVASAET